MKNSLKIAIFSLLFGLIVDILFYRVTGVGLNVLLVQIGFLATAYLLAHLTNHKLSLSTHVAAAISIGFAIPFILWTSDIGTSVAAVGLISADVLFAAFLTGEDARFRHPLELLALFYVPFIIKMLTRLPIFADLSFKVPVNDKSKRILVGVAILIPIFVVFTALFASADAVFQSYVNLPFDDLSKLLHIEDVGEVIAQILLIIFVAIPTTLLFAASFWRREPALEKRVQPQVGETESAVVVTGVVVLFAIFLLVQGVTMFGGEAAMRSLDLTYAEYARQGFEQLIVVGILVASLILTLRYFHGEHTKKHLLALHSFLIVETLLVLVSAFLRVNLYIDAYGFTPERLLAMATIGTLGVLFLVLLANIVQRESQAHFVERALIAMGICGILFSFSGPDAMAANLNVKRAEAGKSLDLKLVAQLSADADPALLKGLTLIGNQKVLPENPLEDIHYACRYVSADRYGTPINDWRLWNLSRLKADYVRDDINAALAADHSECPPPHYVRNPQDYSNSRDFNPMY